MVDEKLPKEIAAKKLELQTYEDVINERSINNQYLTNLQNQVQFMRWFRFDYSTWFQFAFTCVD